MKKDKEAFNKYNEKNKMLFKTKCESTIYHCTRCGKEVTIYSSASSRGDNLICMSCFYHYENNYRGSVFYWLNEKHTEAFE